MERRARRPSPPTTSVPPSAIGSGVPPLPGPGQALWAELREPALQLMTVIEAHGDDALVAGKVDQLLAAFAAGQTANASLRQSITGLQAAINESVARRQQEEARFNREATNEAAEVERKIASLSEELSRAHDQEDRSVIRAPIDGVVKNVRFQTAGNVVKPGEPIMEVVPLKDQLVIEVKLSPSDRGYINMKQDALVKISTYDYLRYGGLDGTVTGIAADTDLGRNEEQFYRVIVSTDKSWLGNKQGQFPITPGMVGEVDIKVDTQSIMWALLKPVLKLKADAFKEI